MYTRTHSITPTHINTHTQARVTAGAYRRMGRAGKGYARIRNLVRLEKEKVRVGHGSRHAANDGPHEWRQQVRVHTEGHGRCYYTRRTHASCTRCQNSQSLESLHTPPQKGCEAWWTSTFSALAFNTLMLPFLSSRGFARGDLSDRREGAKNLHHRCL